MKCSLFVVDDGGDVDGFELLPLLQLLVVSKSQWELVVEKEFYNWTIFAYGKKVSGK